MLEELHEFLSTEQRMEILKAYMLGPKSQSDIVKGCNGRISVSSIDRITGILTYIRVLKKTEMEGNIQKYAINWELWVKEILKNLGFDEIDQDLVKEIAGIVSKPALVSTFIYFSYPAMTKYVFQMMMRTMDASTKKELPVDLLMSYAVKKGSSPADYPLFYILQGSPFSNMLRSFHQLNEQDVDADKNDVQNIINEVEKMYGAYGIVPLTSAEFSTMETDISVLKKKVQQAYSSKIKKEIEKKGDKDEDE
jgi:hypothetical protein